MYSDNDFRLYHGWGKKPEQKAAEKAYNAKYYRLHPEKWGKKENDKSSINKPEAKNKWVSDDKAFDLLSEKYGVDFNKLKLADPKVLLIAISEATNQRPSLNVFNNAAKKLALNTAKFGSFKFSDLLKKNSNSSNKTVSNNERPKAREKNVTERTGSVYRRGNALSSNSVGRR